jgi:hypothetical protein
MLDGADRGRDRECDLPWAGRVRAHRAHRVMHVFGATTIGDTGVYDAFSERGAMWPPEGHCFDTKCGHLFLISTTATEIQRSGAGNIGPLAAAAFQDSAPLPATASRTLNRTQLKCAVTAQVGSGRRRFFMDFAQSIELNALSICVDWVAPGNFVEPPVVLTNGTNPLPVPVRNGAALVVDAQIGIEIAELESSSGNASQCNFTTNLAVAANTQATIAIPPFARALTIYQTSAGAASTIWSQWYGDPAVVASAVEVGSLPFIPGQRKTEPEIDLPNSTHLRTDLDALAARFYTLRWTIRP